MNTPNPLLIAMACDADFKAIDTFYGLHGARAILVIRPDGTVTL